MRHFNEVCKYEENKINIVEYNIEKKIYIQRNKG